MQPLVSVICLNYNQKRFLQEAVESVLQQTHKNIQLIIVDDASTDGSAALIKKLVNENPAIDHLLLNENIGNCRAFNAGLHLAKGDYIIDLAADDVLLPHRVETGIELLQSSGSKYGVHFSDAVLMDEDGKHIRKHSEQFRHSAVPTGDVYKEVIQRYFICSPTVMFTREVANYLKGYDETLSYEDFDFWVRSSRKFYYCYSEDVLVKKRITRRSLSAKQFKVFSRHSLSTYKVCEKIMSLNKSVAEQAALSRRIGSEILLNLRLLNFRTVILFCSLFLANRKMNYAE